MPRVALAFFTAAAVMGAVGMLWGTIMGATHDHSTSPAHAHLNLLGWVTLAIMGLFYGQAPRLAARRRAWVNFGLSVGGVLLFIPILTLVLRGADLGPLILLPVLLMLGGMGVFVQQVASAWRTPASA
jgi:cbb3-type cytochrome oxidase subunit 1